FSNLAMIAVAARTSSAGMPTATTVVHACRPCLSCMKYSSWFTGILVTKTWAIRIATKISMLQPDRIRCLSMNHVRRLVFRIADSRLDGVYGHPETRRCLEPASQGRPHLLRLTLFHCRYRCIVGSRQGLCRPARKTWV